MDTYKTPRELFADFPEPYRQQSLHMAALAKTIDKNVFKNPTCALEGAFIWFAEPAEDIGTGKTGTDRYKYWNAFFQTLKNKTNGI